MNDTGHSGVINTNSIEILWVQNEKLSETVEYEDDDANDAVISAPRCIIAPQKYARKAQLIKHNSSIPR
mgnify:CR=1 FL=1